MKDMKELDLNELEQVNGGSFMVATCIIGVATVAIKVASFVYDYVKDKK